MKCLNCDESFPVNVKETQWYVLNRDDKPLSGCMYPVCSYCGAKHEVEYEELQVNLCD